MKHEPVLFNQVMEWLRPVRPDGVLVDATVGLGGHAEGFLERHPGIRLIGIDQDPAALEESARRLERFGPRVRLIRARHEQIIEILDQEGVGEVDAVLADLGVSSMQFDEPERGFSFRFDGPLDMRMSGEGITAADLVNGAGQEELTRILREYGEEPMAKRIARAIAEARVEEPITTTGRLADLVRSVKRQRRDRIDPATLTFQALRIATNEELVGLSRFVEDSIARLAPSGRLGVISFHSLEDRIVKRTFRKMAGECTCPANLPVCGCGAREIVRLPVRMLEADEEETRRNPRSRSAKMRIAEKVR